MNRINIWWIRRDLRLQDNPALHLAMENGPQVIPLFILDPLFEQSLYVGGKRRWFLYQGLSILDQQLRKTGSRLIIRRGKPLHVLQQLVEECKAQSIFAQEDFSPYAKKRDQIVAARFPLTLTAGVSVLHPTAVLKDDGSPYRVFTPFRKKWKSIYQTTKLHEKPNIITTPVGLSSEPFPGRDPSEPALPFSAGEPEALRRLEHFAGSADAPLFGYRDLRDRLDQDGTSLLSPYLRFGMLSPRAAVNVAVQAIYEAPGALARDSAEKWLDELVWREFYFAILHHFPFVLRTSFRKPYRDIRWSRDRAVFETWCVGQTGIPVVDAAMRQLMKIGWIPNRARMIVASFLTKDLLIDWRWGERYFMQHLVDGDRAANNGGWQWIAGTGTDAAPYFRIFNPITQSEKFDPEGIYLRRWIHELRQVPDKYIHRPWKMPEKIQKQTGCRIGQTYPFPIVDRKFSRARALDAYKKARAK